MAHPYAGHKQKTVEKRRVKVLMRSGGYAEGGNVYSLPMGLGEARDAMRRLREVGATSPHYRQPEAFVTSRVRAHGGTPSGALYDPGWKKRGGRT